MTGAMSAALVLSAFTLTAMNTSAELVEWYSAYPSAEYATYEKFDDYTSYGPYSTNGPRWVNDSTYLNIHGSSNPMYYEVITWDFNNDSYYYDGTDYEVNFLPPDGAEITFIDVVADFYGTQPPECYLAFTVNGGSTWTYSDPFPSYWSLHWRVTDLYDWDDDAINNTNTRVALLVTTEYLNLYRLDYLGWYIGWMAEESGPWSPPDYDTDWGGADLDFNIIYNVGGILGVMGLIGFVGLIAIPAGAIVLYRNDPGQGRINLFIKMVVMWMFCLTMVMVNFAGS